MPTMKKRPGRSNLVSDLYLHTSPVSPKVINLWNNSSADTTFVIIDRKLCFKLQWSFIHMLINLQNEEMVDSADDASICVSTVSHSMSWLSWHCVVMNVNQYHYHTATGSWLPTSLWARGRNGRAWQEIVPYLCRRKLKYYHQHYNTSFMAILVHSHLAIIAFHFLNSINAYKWRIVSTGLNLIFRAMMCWQRGRMQLWHPASLQPPQELKWVDLHTI